MADNKGPQFYRTLVRIETVRENSLVIYVPVWRNNYFSIHKDRINGELDFDKLHKLVCPIRIMVECTIEVTYHINMNFRQWEIGNLVDGDEIKNLKTKWGTNFNSDDAYYMGLTI